MSACRSFDARHRNVRVSYEDHPLRSVTSLPFEHWHKRGTVNFLISLIKLIDKQTREMQETIDEQSQQHKPSPADLSPVKVRSSHNSQPDWLLSYGLVDISMQPRPVEYEVNSCSRNETASVCHSAGRISGDGQPI